MGQYLTLAICLLFFTCVTQSHDLFQPSDSVPKWAYRCGTKIFSPEFLLSVAQDLRSRTREDLSRKSYSPYLQTVDKNFAGITEQDEFPVMWPLLDQGQTLSEHGNDAVYNILLASYNFRLLGVVQKQPDESLVKCIVERDLFELSNDLIATGFRCPTDIFSFETLEAAVLKIKKNRKIKTIKKVDNSNPQPIPEINSLFDYDGQLSRWPIIENGKFNNSVLTSLIVNDHDVIIGMVHRRQKSYLRCRLTASDKIEPRFIGPALNILSQQISEGLDVFKCDREYVRSDSIKVMAAEAVDGFKIKRTRTDNRYPALVSNSFENSPLNLYLWQATLERLVPARNGYQKYKSESVFLLLTDYSDIAAMVYKYYNTDFVLCDRMIKRF